MMARLKTLRLIQASFQAAQLCIASSNLARVLRRVNTWCTMPGSAGPEGDEEDMSDDGDDAGEDAPEDDVQDDATHTFQGHSGLRLLAFAKGIRIRRLRMPCLEKQQAAARHNVLSCCYRRCCVRRGLECRIAYNCRQRRR